MKNYRITNNTSLVYDDSPYREKQWYEDVKRNDCDYVLNIKLCASIEQILILYYNKKGGLNSVSLDSPDLGVMKYLWEEMPWGRSSIKRYIMSCQPDGDYEEKTWMMSIIFGGNDSDK